MIADTLSGDICLNEEPMIKSMEPKIILRGCRHYRVFLPASKVKGHSILGTYSSFRIYKTDVCKIYSSSDVNLLYRRVVDIKKLRWNPSEI